METLPPLPEWLSLEHRVAQILTHQEIHGWFFDEPSAWQLENTLRTELESLSSVLRNRHPFVAGSVFNPKRPNKTQGYFTGCESTRLKELNPTSRDHIAWVMQTFYDWKPEKFTETNKPIIDEVVLKDIGTDIALQFLRCLELTKQLGMLSEGKNAYLKLLRGNRLHHHCSVACETHRCAHRNPNLGQVPSGAVFRGLFKASPGLVMVGADLAGIELRVLAHYLARLDGGRYADVLLNGDIHQENADKIGISRKAVKTVTYAMIYGAGDEKIGHSYDSQLPTDKARKKGKEIRQAYLDAIPGLEKLITAVKAKASSAGYVNSLDGRKIKVDRPHKSLNYLLQSGAAVIAKRWMVIAHDTIKSVGIDAQQLAFVHDEIQFETISPHIDDLKNTLTYAATAAGEHYGLRIRIDAEASHGSSWADTH